MDDICPTEEAIRALFKMLLDPLLPSKPNDDPDESLRESVAKQVHAVLVLYNYYHRRDNPHLESLSFESFCSLATSMRPALLQHFEDSDSEKTILMDKGIVEACRLSMSLDASADLSIWPIRKVAVLLVDSDKMNCYLQHSFITQGVWSLLETPTERKKTTMEKKEVAFQKVAFAAIKEATGVNHKDIVILEKHLARSLSEEKTAVRFYIMKCSSKDSFSPKIPIEEVIKSMQGSLFEKTVPEWVTKDKVRCFHVLPYASFIEDWFARRGGTESVIGKESEAVSNDIKRNRKKDATKESEVSEKSDEVKGKKVAALPRRKATQNRYLKGSTSIMKEPNAVLALGAQNDYKEKAIQRNKDLIALLKTVAEKEEMKKKAVPGRRRSKRIKRKAASSTAHNSNIEELQMSLLSKATDISKTAMNVLLSKRDKLISQHRDIEEEIAKCDNLIQNIEGNWEMQLETILEYCNETCLKESPEKSASKRNKRRKLSETVPPTESMSQKLDEDEVRITGNHDDIEASEYDVACVLTKLQDNITANLS